MPYFEQLPSPMLDCHKQREVLSRQALKSTIIRNQRGQEPQEKRGTPLSKITVEVYAVWYNLATLVIRNVILRKYS